MCGVGSDLDTMLGSQASAARGSIERHIEAWALSQGPLAS